MVLLRAALNVTAAKSVHLYETLWRAALKNAYLYLREYPELLDKYKMLRIIFNEKGIKSIEELPEYENIKIKDEQMLVSDYDKKDDEKVEE